MPIWLAFLQHMLTHCLSICALDVSIFDRPCKQLVGVEFLCDCLYRSKRGYLQISEFIDNSLTALMSVPEDRPRVVDVYMGREKLVGRKDLGPQDAVMNRSTLSYIAIVDSGIGMKDFSPIARRGQVPKRMNEQVCSDGGIIRHGSCTKRVL